MLRRRKRAVTKVTSKSVAFSALAGALLGGLVGAAPHIFAGAIGAGKTIAKPACACDDALLLTFGCCCKEKGAVARATCPPVDAGKFEIPIVFEEVP
jgi:hypothetical protein